MVTRILHWGPLVALSIIKCISFTTIHVIMMWWPPLYSVGAFIHFLVYMVWNGSILYHFLSAIYVGPGYLPLEWQPENEEEKRCLQFCNFCKGYKSPRAHHCRKCNRCVLKMDHHCPWINNCCGHRNHGYFIMFLFIAVVGCTHSAYILCCCLYRALNVTWYYYYRKGMEPLVMFGFLELLAVMFSIGLAIGVIIAVGMLLYFQLKGVVKNETGIESWIIAKAVSRERPENEPFVYPYDLGSYWRNFREVLSISHGCVPPVSGINDWPIREGAEKYTLTIEQKVQKIDKRHRTRQYDIIESYSGWWLPCSKGCKICYHPPFSDEPRINLDVGDKVLVTRWKKYWLYGERIFSVRNMNPSTDEVMRHRGWFPRRCAIEVIDGSLNSSEQKKHL